MFLYTLEHMYKYQIPDLKTPIKKIRTDIERDYARLEEDCSLPENLHFHEVLKAVAVGANPTQNYPFIELQGALLNHLTTLNMLPELFDKAVGLFASVWNYFPHKDLGMSPVEKMREDTGSKIITNELENLSNEEVLFESVFSSADKTLTELAEATKKQTLAHIAAIGGTKNDLADITTILSKPNADIDEAYALIVRRLPTFSQRIGTEIKLNDLQPFNRALMLFESHLAAKMPNGHYTSRMFQNIVEQFSDYGEKLIEREGNMGNKMVALVPPHEQLRMLAFAHATLGVYAKRLQACDALLDAARYILDMLVYIDTRHIAENDPLWSALASLSIAQTISRTVHPTFPLGMSKTALQKAVHEEFDAVTAQNFAEESTALLERVIYDSEDLTPLCANTIKVPKDIVERLTKLAPELALRSPISLSDFSEPSPF